MSKELKAAYAAASEKVGAALVAALANTFGATDGTADDVPEDRRAGLTSALNKLVAGGAIPLAMAMRGAHGDPAPRRRSVLSEGESVFRGIRAEAYGTDADDEKPVAEIDPVAIYARWNAARRKQD
jgi:hypothetical protein